MDWITSDVAIGNYLEAQDADLLSREGIRSVLSLDGTLKAADTARLGLEAVEAFALAAGPGDAAGLFRWLASGCLLAAGVAWFWAFNYWLRNRPFLREQGTQDLSLIAVCGGVLFVAAAHALRVWPLPSGWVIAIPLAVWLVFVGVYLSGREW